MTVTTIGDSFLATVQYSEVTGGCRMNFPFARQHSFLTPAVCLTRGRWNRVLHSMLGLAVAPPHSVTAFSRARTFVGRGVCVVPSRVSVQIIHRKSR